MFLIYGAVLQGGQDGQPIFCLILMVVIVRMKNTLPEVVAAALWVFLFVDDVTASCFPQHVETVVSSLETAAAHFKFLLVRENCAMHAPEGQSNPQPEVRAQVEDRTGIGVRDEGIVLMGTVAGGGMRCLSE